MPKDGKSVGRIALARPVADFAAVDASRMARSRRTGLAMFVARLTRVMVACVVYSVLPGSRSEIGTAASSGSPGRSPWSSR